MKTSTKKQIENYCSVKNFPLPRFSGKMKTMYVNVNKLSYNVEQRLIEMSNSMGYKMKIQISE
jgi:hypothetical protein